MWNVFIYACVFVGMIVYRVMHGNVEVRRLVDRLTGISRHLHIVDAEVCAMLRMPPNAWPVSRLRALSWQPEIWTETRLRRLVETLEMTAAFRVDDAATWLRANNRELRGRCPVDVLMEDGDGHVELRDRLREEDDR